MKKLVLNNISKSYIHHGVENKVIEGVDIEIDNGKMVAIMGASGSGKSTLLKIMGGYLTPDSGVVRYGDEKLDYSSYKDLKNQRKRLSTFIHQELNLIEFMTGMENIELALINSKVQLKEAYENIDKVTKDLGIVEIVNNKVKFMSGGEKQRVALARALVLNTDYILADEPTGSLDRRNSDEFMSILSKMVNTKKLSVVIVTHDPKVASYCDRTIYLEE